eukprot:3286862-Prymnesium_polylepis.2
MLRRSVSHAGGSSASSRAASSSGSVVASKYSDHSDGPRPLIARTRTRYSLSSRSPSIVSCHRSIPA